ncbi:MAG: hypothetical protein K0Q49_1314 [Haloplasmataceae bacterium]|jgi:hypothetical protein|nr:hypothetical protein [Haloplasmataceae bacterium]
MVLDNVLILRGNYYDIKDVKDEIDHFIKKPNSSKLYNNDTFKAIKKLMIEEEKEDNGLYNLKINFKYTKTNIEKFIHSFNIFPVEIIHMCENAKKEIWIVNKNEFIIKYRLIPAFAINHVLLDYMDYRDSAIILDSFETIKYDINNKRISVDNKYLTYEELLILLFEKTIKGRHFFDIIENFITNYYELCINTFEELYSISKESSKTEETTPLALFIVTFGLFGLILVLLKVMGYL